MVDGYFQRGDVTVFLSDGESSSLLLSRGMGAMRDRLRIVECGELANIDRSSRRRTTIVGTIRHSKAWERNR